MPQFTGNSDVGFEEGAAIASRPDQWVSLEILGQDFESVKERHGLLLVGFTNSSGSLRVIETFKLFGGGIFVLPRWPISNNNGAIVFDWYVSGLSWRLDVPFNPFP